ncbi:MAG: NCS2 family permease [Deltaproteobacteria bacterium]|nr:NCS2 family permease [Deltaproteobacteria bacterium]
MTRPEAPSLRTEIVAGVTTFFTMAYIVILNPAILAAPGTGMPFGAVMSATVLLAASMTLLMGLYAKLPYAVAPGMGINAFFAFGLVIGKKIPWPVALGIVFWAGVLFVVVSATNLRVGIARAIPKNIRAAAAVGIGIFLAFIGLKNAGLVVADPATFVRLGVIDLRSALAVAGVFFATALMRRKSPFAFLATIGVITAISLPLGLAKMPARILAVPDITLLGKLDVMGALKLSLLPAIAAILITDLFDSISTFIGVSQAAKLVDEHGEPLRLKEGLLVDAFATLGAALLGTSSGTAYIESTAGVEVGGRTGRTSVVTALCFLPCLVIGPLAEVVPPHATAPVLVVVGALMFRSVKTLAVEALEDAVPAYLTIVLIPLTFSITQGILWGFIAHCAAYALSGRASEIKAGTWGLGAVSIALLVLERFQ